MISKDTIERIKKFNEERDWTKFHSPSNLAKSIAIEAGELLECFQWSDEYSADAVKEELADVMIYCIDMVSSLGYNADEIINAKISRNEEKYPVDFAKGNSKKYTELQR